MARLLVLSFLVFVVVQLMRHVWATPRRVQSSPGPARQARTKSPHEVLGVEPSASRDEVRAAYQKLVQENHPDKVSGMSEEIRNLAERRTKEINAAYNELKKRV